MRRITAAASVVTVLAPLLLAGASTASAAAKGSLTVTTLDSGGKPVYAQVAVYNTKTYDFRYITSNKAASLPDGSYELATSFTDSTGGRGTVGGHSVTVSGSTKTTFDARQGRPVSVSLSPSPGGGYDRSVSAYVCTADNGPAVMGLSAAPGDLYVIPSSSKAYELSYGTTYEPTSAAGGDVWLATATHKGGVPSGVSAALKRSGLTALKVSARSGPDSGSARFSFDNQISSGDSCPMSTNHLSLRRDLPNYFTAHLPPGQWSVSQQARDFVYDGFHNYAAGKTTSLTLGHAVWGPGGAMPYTWYHQLYLDVFDPFADPTLPAGGTLATGTVKLTHSGKTLYSHAFSPSSTPSAQPVIPGAGWYTFSEVGRRGLPSGSLSTTSTLTLRFYADPAKNQEIRDYVTRFWPNGLDTRNRAVPGSTTSVDLGMRRDGTGDGSVARLPDGVKSVRAWYTTDGGGSWHTTAAKLSGGKWTIAVHNPATGRVGLRSTVTDTHGDSSTTTVYNAYVVS
ncbi:hypothetical protein [Streptomyces sp. LaBMicrA B280]|uniref:hypothetical protein n=1 Tax=Streptomyces sp. LaBMicrA B280 TaxID=3391001 RepID=UPI003BA465EF